MAKSVFMQYTPQAYPYMFRVTLHVERLVGGVPSDPKVAEGWIRTKLGWDSEKAIQQAVAEVMTERGIGADEATEVVNKNKNLNGFKRDEDGLYIEGRQVKAAIKEAANIRWPSRRWGPTRKGTMGFFSEHVFCQEDHIYLDRKEPDGVNQQFVHVWRGSGIKYEEFVNNVDLAFTVATDFDFSEEDWGVLWLTGEQNGIGASRSQGNGRYSVTEWEPIK